MSTPSRRSTQQLPSITAGQASQVFVNHGWRDAKILAVHGLEALLEYQMSRFSGLRILDLRTMVIEEDAGSSCVGVLCRDRSVRYEDLSVQWLATIVDARQHWIGTPLRGTPQGKLPPPDVMLERKRGTYI